MKTNTRENIHKYISENKPVTIKNIVEDFQISKQIIHLHVSKLISEGKIYKLGTPPKVYYFSTEEENTQIPSNFQEEDATTLDNNFVYFSPNGEVVYGVKGFIKWCKKRNIDHGKEIGTYIKTIEKYNAFKDKNGYIDGTAKMLSTFDSVALDKVIYLDFYSIEKYGKTLLGNLMLYAKQTNNKELGIKITNLIKERLYKLIEIYDIDAFAFIPPSVDRKVQLMTEMRKGFNLKIDELTLLKIFKDKPVPQKSLKKKEDRIINASETIFIGDNKFKCKNILLIDDAVGSGATLNETAKKIKQKGMAEKVFGLAVVGSYKGFEVISEV